MRVIDIKKELDRLKEFYDSLEDEKKTFTLPWALLEKSNFVVVEERDGKIIGIDGIHSNCYTFTCIKKEYQGQGIGAKLVKERNRILKQNKIGIVYASTQKDNIIARRLMKKIGYSLVKIEDDMYHYELCISMKAKFWKYFRILYHRAGLKKYRTFLRPMSVKLKSFKKFM